MRQIIMILLPVFLIGCEPERKAGGSVTDVKHAVEETEKDEVSNEAKRKAIVRDLLQQLALTTLEEKESIFTDLRDVYVRKRDIPDLVNAIDRSENLEVKNRLKSLISYIDGWWRLPNKSWTDDIDLCVKTYEKEFERFGCFVIMGEPTSVYSHNPDLMLDVFDCPSDAKLRAGVVDLILMLEPEALMLSADWNNNTKFVKILKNLKVLTVDGEQKERDKIP